MISGTVKDSSGAFAPRAVRVHRKSDGALSGATVSHATTGAFTVPALDATPHYAITHDSDADPYWPNVVLATHFDTDSVIDPYMSSVVLGLHMEGANASTVFQDVTGKTVTAVGNAQISTAQAKFGNTSALFDGTGDYLSCATSTSFDPGTGAFTVEGWYRFAVLPTAGTNASLAAKYNGTGNQRSWFFLFDNTGGGYTLKMATSPDGTSATASTLTSSAITPVVGAWHHIAWVRETGVNRLFFDGVQVAYQTSAPAIFAGTAALTFGASSDGSAQFINGNVDDIRITKGVARYTANFTPPTVPFSSFKDLTGKDLLVNGVPSISTATKKYGDGALYFDGTGDFVSVADTADLNFGSSDWTIEGYINLSALGAGRDIFGKRYQASVQSIVVYVTGTNFLSIGASIDGTTLISPTDTTALVSATWYHFAAVRKGSTLILYKDGVQVAQANITGSLFAYSGVASLGGANDGLRSWFGYIDDLRITKGVARYLANFTPPERAFPGAMGAGTNNALIFDDLTPV